MNINAFIRLIKMKINSAHKKAQNPFIDSSISYNPFCGPMQSTLVWIEQDDYSPNSFKSK